MRLVNRVSAFFLIALAVVLLTLSTTLYGLAHSYLYRQLSDRLDTALDILEASVDVEPDGLEWEPLDRRIMLGHDPGAENVRWIVCDEAGHIVDRSENCGSDFPFSWKPVKWPARPPDGTVFGDSAGWWLGSRRLRLEELMKFGPRHVTDNSPDDDTDYPVLLISVGVSPLTTQADLRHLALTLASASLVTWIVCALLGQWFCRRALAPVSRMVDAARQMTASGSEAPLPVAHTGDELEALGDSFNQLLGRLHSLLHRQQQFAGDASHQLRTPLAGLLSLIDVTRRRERTSDEYVEALDRVRTEVSRMTQIVESLLFLARSTAETGVAPNEVVNLKSWLPEQRSHWDAHPRHHDLAFVVNGEPTALVRAQPALLAQLLAILVDNALKYSESGSSVQVTLVSNGGMAGFAVSDTGMGIAADDMPQIFEPFYRSGDARTRGYPGMGLGLAIARRIVETSGGVIQVESAITHGSRFEVLFSVVDESLYNKSTGTLVAGKFVDGVVTPLGERVTAVFVSGKSSPH